MIPELSSRTLEKPGVPSGMVILLSMFAILFSSVTAQEESDGPSVSDLESYQDLPVKEGSEEDHWYQISFGDQWIGWGRMQSKILKAFQEGGTDPMTIHQYKHSSQVSPHLVREQLKTTFREQIRTEQEDRVLTSNELDKLVENKVQSRMDALRNVIERRSFSTTIYRNRNQTLREARYGFSSDRSGSFTLYLEPKQLGSGRYTLLVPGEVPREITVSRERPIANHYLATRLMARDSFEKSSYEFFLLAGSSDDPLVRANVKMISQERELEELQLGENTYRTHPANVVLNYPDGRTMEEKWWIGEDGVIRKIEQLPGEEGGTKITLRYSSREDARKGYEFVFARRGRRNPFKPVWPKQSSQSTEEKEGECSDYKGKEEITRAKEIVFERAAALDRIDRKQKKIEAQRALIQDFNRIKSRVNNCGEDTEQEQIKKLEKELQGIIEIGKLILSIARDKYNSAERAFEQRAFDRVTSLAQEVTNLKSQLPSSASDEKIESFEEIAQSSQSLSERAQIRKSFLNNAPQVRGVISSQNDRIRRMNVGVDVFGDGISTEIDVNLPDVNSIAILESQQDGQRDKAKRPGESMEIEGLDDEVRISEVHRDGVVFKYKGESIKVPLLKVEQTFGQKE